MTIIRYSIEYYDSVLQHDDVTDKGFACGDNAGDAINKVIEYYGGSDNVGKISFYETMTSDSGILTDDTVKDSEI